MNWTTSLKWRAIFVCGTSSNFSPLYLIPKGLEGKVDYLKPYNRGVTEISNVCITGWNWSCFNLLVELLVGIDSPALLSLRSVENMGHPHLWDKHSYWIMGHWDWSNWLVTQVGRTNNRQWRHWSHMGVIKVGHRSWTHTGWSMILLVTHGGHSGGSTQLHGANGL